MKRRELHHAGPVLTRVAEGAAPATTLARVQRCWPRVVGPAVSAESDPSAERDGIVTVSCRSAVWASELDLLSSELLPRLNASLRAPEGRPLVRGLRFVTRRAD